MRKPHLTLLLGFLVQPLVLAQDAGVPADTSSAVPAAPATPAPVAPTTPEVPAAQPAPQPEALPTEQPGAQPMAPMESTTAPATETINDLQGIVPVMEPSLPGEQDNVIGPVEALLMPQTGEDGLIPGEGISAIEPMASDNVAPSKEEMEQAAVLSAKAVGSPLRRFTFMGGAGFYHEDNIRLSPTNPESDTGIQYSVKTSVRLLDRAKIKLVADYSLSHVSLDNHPEFDQQTQDGSLQGDLDLGRTKISFSGNYGFFTGADRQIAAVNERSIIGGMASITREIGAKTNFVLSARYNDQQNEGLLSNTDTAFRAELNYLFGGRTRLGVAYMYGTLITSDPEVPVTLQAGQSGVRFSQLSISAEKALAKEGFNQANTAAEAAREVANAAAAQLQEAQKNQLADPRQIQQLEAQAAAAADQAAAAEELAGSAKSNADRQSKRSEKTPDQSYHQFLLTANYQATGKLSLVGDFGVDLRRYSGSEAADSSTNLTYSLGAEWQARERTRVSLRANRQTVGAVSVQGAAIERTFYSLGVQQSIGEKLTLEGTLGYDINSFQSIRSDVNLDREDSHWRPRVELNYSLFKHAGLRLFWEGEVNDSSAPELNYENSRYGIQVGIVF